MKIFVCFEVPDMLRDFYTSFNDQLKATGALNDPILVDTDDKEILLAKVLSFQKMQRERNDKTKAELKKFENY